VLAILFLNSCGSYSEQKASSPPMQEISGRESAPAQARFPVYRVRAPAAWIRRDPLPDDPLADTRKALVEFIIQDFKKDSEKDPKDVVRLWIHNFPTDSINQRIPPMAQKERWQRQFETFYPHDTDCYPEAFNGYAGVRFFIKGSANGCEKSVLAWALLIDTQHYQALAFARTAKEETLYKQMRADVTIKAEGPPEVLEQHKQEIIAFAHSFELIEEIPNPW
jgi:hypothetical protein